MSDLRALVIKSGTTQNISNADTLIVGTKVDAASLQALSIGTVNATGITIGSALVTTDFPGPVNLTGDVTTVGGTQFTTDATFDGNVTFGNAASDNISFVGQVDTAITQEGIAAPAVSPAGTGRIYFDSGTNTFKASQNGGAYVDIITGGTVTSVGASSPLSSSGGVTPSISFPSWPVNASGFLSNNGSGTLSWASAPAASLTVGSTAIASGAVNRVLFEGAGNVLQESANLTWDGSTFTVGGVLSLAEGAAPTATAAFGKLWANSAADARPYWVDDTGQSFNLTLDRFNTLTPAASVAIDTSPALPVFNSLSLNQNTTFTTSNLGNGRSASVRVICDGTTRTLTFPSGPTGWKWLGSGMPPTSLAAGDVGYLSITAYGAANADVVAAWSYENQAAPVTGTGVDNQIAVWSGTNTQDGSASLTFDGTTFSVTSAAVSLTANAASSLTTSSGALTLTSAAAATWSTAAGDLAISGGAALQLTAAAGNEVVVNDGSADVDFRVESDTNTHALFVQGSDSNVGIGIAVPTASLHVAGTVLAKNAANSTAAFDVQNAAAASQLRVDTTNSKLFFAGVATTNTHTVNIGTSGTDPAFAIASGGRIHYYDGSQPTNGQVLIGDTAAGNFAKFTLTAGSGVSITNGAGSITIAATGSAIDMDTSGVAVADACYVSASGVVSRASAFAPTAPKYRQARVVGIASTSAVAGKVLMSGKATATFVSGLTLVAGDPIYLSLTSGLLTNDVSAITASGDAIAEVGMLTSSLSYGSALDSGTAISGGASTLTVSGTPWTVNQFAGNVVTITGGTGSGQVRKIASNTVNTLTVGVAWGTAPDNTSTYAISDGDAQIAVQPKSIVVL